MRGDLTSLSNGAPNACSLLVNFDWKLPDGMELESLDMSEAFGLSLAMSIPCVSSQVSTSSQLLTIILQLNLISYFIFFLFFIIDYIKL